MPTTTTTTDPKRIPWWRRLLRSFVFDNLFIALCATGLVKVTETVLDIGTRWTVIDAFVFCGTLCVYNMHSGVSRLPHQSPMSVLQNLFSPASRLPARGLVLVGLLGTIISFFFLHPSQQISAAAMALLTLAYTFPLLRIKKSPKRVREIYLFKIGVIGMVWSLATVMLPAMPDHFNSLSAFLLVAERWLFVMAITVPFEIRDMEQEKLWGNVTLPVAIGVKQSMWVALGMLALYLVLLGLHFRLCSLSPALFGALALSAVPAAITVLATTESRGNFYYKFFVDGTMMLQYLFVILMN